MPESTAADASIDVRDAPEAAADLSCIRSCSLSSQAADDPPAHSVRDGGYPMMLTAEISTAVKPV